MVAMLNGCGLRRAGLLALSRESIQRRDKHWVIADLVGKGARASTSWPTRPAAHLRRLCPLAAGELDQILSRPRLHPDDGALPRMQTEAPDRRERLIEDRT